MPIYRYKDDGIEDVKSRTFAELEITERYDLQRLLRDRIDIIAPGTLVISEEFGNWDDSRRRIDLLAIDREANLVVIELKRTDDGGHMELQAIRYAAMVSTLTFDQAVEVFADYLHSRNDDRDAEKTILAFLGWVEPQKKDFANTVRIVLASQEFSKEVTTAVLWLREAAIGLDITCVRMVPYGSKTDCLLDIQQVIPLPEANDYQIKVREKQQEQRHSTPERLTLPAFWIEFERQNAPEITAVARDLLNWIQPLVTDHFSTRDGIAQILERNDLKYYFFKVAVDGQLHLWLQYFCSKAPFSESLQLQTELIQKINTVAGFSVSSDRLNGRPKFPLSSLVDETNRQQFKNVMSWVIEQVQTPEH